MAQSNLFSESLYLATIILNTLLFLFSNKMLIIRAGIHKMLVMIANREHPDQTASSDQNNIEIK